MMNRHMFQSTHPRGVRHHWEPVPDSGASFNPRTRVGCDQVLRDQGVEPDKGFNPRTRVGCDPVALMRLYNLFLFQSTHPRGVRPHQGARPPASGIVSIHAPAWGATSHQDGHQPEPDPVSIHAPAWGATRQYEIKLGIPRKVSIHAPAWGATVMNDTVQALIAVSIHAPAWGATPCRTRRGPPVLLFQSTHPRGVRRSVQRVRARTLGVSIHAPAWGATLLAGRLSIPIQCFNPRTRVGCDLVRRRGRRALPRVSIHAPAWGATGKSLTVSGPTLCFNPRTRVGCDFLSNVLGYAADVFQSTHPRGVRRIPRWPCGP